MRVNRSNDLYDVGRPRLRYRKNLRFDPVGLPYHRDPVKSRGEMRMMSCEPELAGGFGRQDDWFRGIAYLPTLSGISFSRIHKTLRPTDLVSLKIPYDSGFVFFQPRSVNE